MHILGIETSCDETGIALVEASGGLKKPRFRVLKNLVASQIKIHTPFGGVVPNLAKREHAKNLPILLKKLKTKNYKLKTDVIAVTVGPGLEPCLWQGIGFAKELAKKYKKPIIAVNHMAGHIVSVLLTPQNDAEQTQKRAEKIKGVNFPALALLVSGGHTELVLIKNWLDYKIIGETLDDAVGEAFDKVARLLGLPYPGGPALERLAAQCARNNTEKTLKNAEKIQCKSASVPHSSALILPRPMLNSKDFNFSFSGLKTAVLYALRGNPKINKAALAKEFQNAAVEVLVVKTLKAVAKYKPKTLIVAGGVAANKLLQKELNYGLKTKNPALPAGRYKLPLFFPKKAFTGDNAAMIAAGGYFKASKKGFASARELRAQGRLRLS